MDKLYSYLQASHVYRTLWRKGLFSLLLFTCIAAPHLEAQYCQPVWEGPSCGSTNGDDIISGFVMNNVNDQNLGCPQTDPNFIDSVAATCVNACAGSTYSITLTPGYTLTGNDEYFAVYIDFNSDGAFQANEFFPLGNSTSGSPVTGSITIPPGTPSASTRLRIVCQSFSQGIAPTLASACGISNTFGEAVDFCISITGTPVINLGSDTEQCGGVRVLDAGSGGESSVTYLWSDSSTSEFLTASTSGNYSVTVSNGPTCSATASANVYIKPVPVVDLGPAISLCGGAITLDAGNPGSDYLWSTGTGSEFLIVDSTALYSVTVVNPNGDCTASSSVQVTIGAVPVVNLGPSVNQCGGSVTLDAGNPGATYLWSNGSTAETLTVTSTGFYEVTVTGISGCTATGAQGITINPAFQIGNDTTVSVCPDTTANLLLIFPDLGYSSYVWSTSTPQTAGPGVYTVTITNQTGCSDSATATINNFPAPVLSPPPPVNVCPGSTTDLTAIYPNQGFSSYAWTPSTETMAVAGNYTLVVTNSDGCGATVTVSVGDYPKPYAGPNLIDSICPLTTINLDSLIPDTGTSFADGYTWSIANPDFATTGTYFLIVVNSDGCGDTVSATIVNYEIPNVTIPYFPDVCSTHQPIVLTGGSPPGGVYTVDGIVDSIFYPDSASIGDHIVIYTYTTYAGCIKSADTSFVVHAQPFITISSVPQLCTSSTPLNLDDYFTPPGGAYSGLGVSGHYFYSTLSPPGTDTVVDIYTDEFGCMDTSSYTIVVQPAVHVQLSSSVADFTICKGQSITFTATGAVNYQFFVNDTAMGPASPDSTFTTDTLSNHSFIYVVGTNVCSSDTSEEIIIDVIPPPTVSAGPDTTIQLGQSVQLQGVAIGATPLLYIWYPDTGLNYTTITNPVYSGSDSVTLWFRATDTYGCSDSAKVIINVNVPDNVLLPNIITPNGDGKNDVWKLNPKINLDGSHLVIFNRWGETVYEADNYTNDWGGTYKSSSKKLPDGTYYYILKVPAQNNHVYKGAINLISGDAK